MRHDHAGRGQLFDERQGAVVFGGQGDQADAAARPPPESGGIRPSPAGGRGGAMGAAGPSSGLMYGPSRCSAGTAARNLGVRLARPPDDGEAVQQRSADWVMSVGQKPATP